MHALSLLAQDGGGSGIGSLIFLLAIPVVMYFLLIRPQRRRMKEQASLQSSIGIGDEVITTSGIYGFITGEEGDRLWLEIDDDVQIRIARAAVQQKVDTSTTVTDTSTATSTDTTDTDTEPADGGSNSTADADES